MEVTMTNYFPKSPKKPENLIAIQRSDQALNSKSKIFSDWDRAQISTDLVGLDRTGPDQLGLTPLTSPLNINV